MSATDDDVRAGLARAAGGIDPPVDAVALVRAEVGRRRRRRSATRTAAVSAGAAAVLVGAVFLTPGQVLPGPADLRRPASAPSDPSSAGVLLGPAGFDSLALGEPVAGLDETTLVGEPGGCRGTVLFTDGLDVEILGDAGAGGTQLEVWVRDGVLVQIVLAARPERVRLPGDTPRTWLGPTLRDPLAAALDLDGARLVADDPLGDDGPPVTNVVVGVDGGGEIVFTDVPVGSVPADGRISAVVLRDPAGRGCGYDPAVVGQPGQGLPDQVGTVVLSASGAAGVTLGGSVADAVAAGALVAEPSDGFEDPIDGRGCTRYRTPADGLSVWADGDRVVGVASLGRGPRFELATEVLDVRSGQRLDEVGPAGTTEGAVPVPLGMQGSAVDLPAGPGVRARVVGAESLAVAATTGLVVGGSELVDGVLLYLGDDPAVSLCTS